MYRRGKIFYCQFYNQKTGKYLPGRSTGQTNRDAATLVVYEWERNGIPDRGGGSCRPVSEAIDLDTIIETIRKTDLTSQDAERIVAALKTRGLIETAVVKAGPVDEVQRRTIMTSRDRVKLDRAIDMVLVADSAEEVLAVIL